MFTPCVRLSHIQLLWAFFCFVEFMDNTLFAYLEMLLAFPLYTFMIYQRTLSSAIGHLRSLVDLNIKDYDIAWHYGTFLFIIIVVMYLELVTLILL